jgi:hypothetical protein
MEVGERGVISYTNEELWLLTKRMPNTWRDPIVDDVRGMHGVDIHGWYLSGLDVKLMTDGPRVYITSFDMVPGTAFNRELYKILYKLPLLEMPLYINRVERVLVIIATWRMEIAK